MRSGVGSRLASRSGASLHIVHAYRSSLASDPSGFVVWSNSNPVEVALTLVEDAARRAKVHAPGLIVTAAVKDGKTALHSSKKAGSRT